jgi:hypothetical protein
MAIRLIIIPTFTAKITAKGPTINFHKIPDKFIFKKQ